MQRHVQKKLCANVSLDGVHLAPAQLATAFAAAWTAAKTEFCCNQQGKSTTKVRCASQKKSFHTLTNVPSTFLDGDSSKPCTPNIKTAGIHDPVQNGTPSSTKATAFYEEKNRAQLLPTAN
jgi:hypothetical protein